MRQGRPVLLLSGIEGFLCANLAPLERVQRIPVTSLGLDKVLAGLLGFLCRFSRFFFACITPLFFDAFLLLLDLALLLRSEITG